MTLQRVNELNCVICFTYLLFKFRAAIKNKTINLTDQVSPTLKKQGFSEHLKYYIAKPIVLWSFSACLILHYQTIMKL